MNNYDLIIILQCEPKNIYTVIHFILPTVHILSLTFYKHTLFAFFFLTHTSHLPSERTRFFVHLNKSRMSSITIGGHQHIATGEKKRHVAMIQTSPKNSDQWPKRVHTLHILCNSGRAAYKATTCRILYLRWGTTNGKWPSSRGHFTSAISASLPPVDRDYLNAAVSKVCVCV